MKHKLMITGFASFRVLDSSRLAAVLTQQVSGR